MMLNSLVPKVGKVAEADLSQALGGVNGGWLRSSLALADRSDLLAFALDAAMFASVLFERAAAQLAVDIREREQRDSRLYS